MHNETNFGDQAAKVNKASENESKFRMQQVQSNQASPTKMSKPVGASLNTRVLEDKRNKSVDPSLKQSTTSPLLRKQQQRNDGNRVFNEVFKLQARAQKNIELK